MRVKAYAVGIISLLGFTAANGEAAEDECACVFKLAANEGWDSPIKLAYDFDSPLDSKDVVLGVYNQDPDTAIALLESQDVVRQKKLPALQENTPGEQEKVALIKSLID